MGISHLLHYCAAVEACSQIKRPGVYAIPSETVRFNAFVSSNGYDAICRALQPHHGVFIV